MNADDITVQPTGIEHRPWKVVTVKSVEPRKEEHIFCEKLRDALTFKRLELEKYGLS